MDIEQIKAAACRVYSIFENGCDRCDLSDLDTLTDAGLMYVTVCEDTFGQDTLDVGDDMWLFNDLGTAFAKGLIASQELTAERDRLLAANRDLVRQVAEPVKVKPLEWERGERDQYRSMCGQYVCTKFGAVWHHDGHPYGSLCVAQAAADERHAARIREALE